MKALVKLLLVLSYSLISVISLSQINPKIKPHLFPKYYANHTDLSCTPTIDCTPRAQPAACGNFIINNTFTPTIAYNPGIPQIYEDPFSVCPPSYGYIPNWQAAQGDPTIDDLLSKFFFNTTVLPPFSGAGYAQMASFVQSSVLNNEGIAQKIPALTPGNKYCLSFFEKLSIDPNFPSATTKFNIVLMHCSDFPNILPPLSTYQTPPIPANAQTVYCETGVSDQNWKQKVVSFIATGNYDLIWIFPKANQGPDYEVGVDFSYPELIDVNGFTAGSNPNPTPENCNVTIGPATPNACTIHGAIFIWTHTKPDGTIISINAPANQQIQVDASNLNNVGVWTLSMTANGVTNTNNNCSQLLSATVNVPPCNVWPKAYGTGDGPGSVLKDNKGNVILTTSDISNSSTFFNHVGVRPGPLEDLSKTFQYTSNGVTNWTKYQDVPFFAFKSGVLEMIGPNLGSGAPVTFIDGTTGNNVTAPVNLSPGEIILAETNSNAVITALYNQLKVYSSGGTSTTAVSGSGSHYKFNPITNNLDVIISGLFGPSLSIYHFNGVSFDPPQSYSLPYSWWNTQSVHFDSHDRYYFLQIPNYGSNNQVLKQFDYTTGLITTVNIPGFNNQFLSLGSYNSNYASDKIIMFNTSDNYLYALDFSTTPGSKKILTTNFTPPYSYDIDGDDLYLLSTNIGGNAVTIGNQNIPAGNQNYAVPIYIAKLNIQTDFNFRSNQAVTPALVTSKIQVSVQPNPSYNTIDLGILYDKKKVQGNYLITITNSTGRVVLKSKTTLSNTRLNTSNWEKGVYYVEITNEKGEKSSTSFIKL